MIAVATSSSESYNKVRARARAQFSREKIVLADIFDKNASGTIDLGEFQQLFDYINQWKGVFQSFDKDRSGRIEQGELTQGNSPV